MDRYPGFPGGLPYLSARTRAATILYNAPHKFRADKSSLEKKNWRRKWLKKQR